MKASRMIFSALMVLCAGVSATASSADHVVHLKGKKAQKIVSLFQAAKATQEPNDGLTGAISILCKYPNGSTFNDSDLNCQVQAANNPSEVVELRNKKAHKLVTLMGAANAIADSQDSCGMGSCYLNGTLAISCTTLPSADAEKAYACDVTSGS